MQNSEKIGTIIIKMIIILTADNFLEIVTKAALIKPCQEYTLVYQ